MTFLTIVIGAMVVVVVAHFAWFRTLVAELERDAPWLGASAGYSPLGNSDSIRQARRRFSRPASHDNEAPVLQPRTGAFCVRHSGGRGFTAP